MFTTADALARGLTRDQIRQRVRSGAWVRLAKGTYTTADFLTLPDPHQAARVDHAARALAAATRHAGSVVGFGSAAALHGLPQLRGLSDEVTLIVPPGHWTGRRGRHVLRYVHLPPGHVEHPGPPVTSAARTWFDIARTTGLTDALVTGDAGIRNDAFALPELQEVLAQAEGTAGWARAASALAQLDGHRESPLESASCAYFVRHGVAQPEPQHEFYDCEGLIGRVDFWWADGIVGECDGRMKYMTADDLYREKLREDRLRALGVQVVRWGWPDLRTPRLAARLPRLRASPT